MPAPPLGPQLGQVIQTIFQRLSVRSREACPTIDLAVKVKLRPIDLRISVADPGFARAGATAKVCALTYYY